MTASQLPVVNGSVRAVRTFRLLRSGALAPVGPRAAWGPGTTTALCDREAHLAPAPGCTCGLWAYGSLQALRESDLAEQRQVVVVVRCHGQVVPARLGLRAQHAALEAMWLADDVDRELAGRVVARYPETATYRSLPAMLAEHPLTALPSYRLPRPARPLLLHLQLGVTVAWYVAMLVWLVLTPPGPRSEDLPVSWLDAAAIVVPLAVAGVATWVALTPSRWPWGLVAVGVQTASAVLAHLLLEPWVAFEHLGVVAGAAGCLHVAAAHRARRLRLGLVTGSRRRPGGSRTDAPASRS